MKKRNGLHLPFHIDPSMGPDAVEFRDENGTPLVVASANIAPRINLIQRFVALVLFAPDVSRCWRVLLRRETEGAALFPNMWDLAALGPVLPGEAVEDAAWRMTAALHLQRLAELPGAPEPVPSLSITGVLSPKDTETFFNPVRYGSVELTLVRGYLPVPVRSSEKYLWLDAEECQGFLDSFSESLSPVLAWMGKKKLLSAGSRLS